jgi:hypothetical protein
MSQSVRVLRDMAANSQRSATGRTLRTAFPGHEFATSLQSYCRNSSVLYKPCVFSYVALLYVCPNAHSHHISRLHLSQ